MREEEEAARLSLGLSGLEHCLIVESRRQGLLDLLIIDAVELSELFEDGKGEVRNSHLLIDDLLLDDLRSTSVHPAESLMALRHKLVILSDIPLPRVVNPDLVQLKRTNVVTRSHLCRDLGLTLLVSVAREPRDAGQDYVYQLDVER